MTDSEGGAPPLAPTATGAVDAVEIAREDAIPIAPIERLDHPPAARDRLRSLGEVLLCSGFPTQLVVTAILLLAGLRYQVAPGQLSLTFIALLLFLDTSLVLALILLFLRRRRESPRAVFLDARPVGRELVAGLVFVPILFLGASLILLAIREIAPWMRNPEGNPFESLLTTPTQTAVFATVAVVAGGVREEIQRAFILRRFEQHLGGPITGLLVFSVAFGLGHALQGWDAAVTTAALGVAWGWMYLARRSIIAAVVSHSLFNLGMLLGAAAIK